MLTGNVRKVERDGFWRRERVCRCAPSSRPQGHEVAQPPTFLDQAELLVILQEKILVDPLELNHPAGADPYPMLDHQICKLLPMLKQYFNVKAPTAGSIDGLILI